MVTSNKSKPVSKFHDLVYKVCKEIPKGKVATYKELAQKIGSPKAVRAVGNALRNNPFAPVVIGHINFHFKLYAWQIDQQVPCHRVVASTRLLGKGLRASDLYCNQTMNVKIEWYTIGGFQGSKDPQGSCLKKKKMMLEEEGVLFEDDSRIRIECLHTFEE